MATPKAIRDAVAMLISVRLANGPVKEDEVHATCSTWLLVFRDLSDEELSLAIGAHVRSERWWPAPADLFKHLETAADMLPSASQAFEDAVKAASKGWTSGLAVKAAVEAYGAPVEGPFTHALMAVGGTRQLGQEPIEAAHDPRGFNRARVLKTWSGAWEEGRDRQAARGRIGMEGQGLLGVGRG